MSPKTPQERLREILTPQMRAVELAKICGVKRQAVDRWQRDGRPEPHLRPAIEAATGIPEEDWMTEEELAQREHAIEAARAKSGEAA